MLLAGLANGVLLRTEVDRVTGQLSDTRTRFLGTRPPKLFGVRVRGNRAMLALSSRPWLGYSDQGRYTLTPLSYEALDHCSGFSSEQCPEGFCAVAKGTLRILALERLGETFNQQVGFRSSVTPFIPALSLLILSLSHRQTATQQSPWLAGDTATLHAAQVCHPPRPQDAGDCGGRPCSHPCCWQRQRRRVKWRC